MEAKEVNFNGDKILAVWEEKKVYVAVGWVCRALGLQYRKQADKLKRHAVLSKGVSLRAVPSPRGNQATLVLEVDYLPLWLATVNPEKVSLGQKKKLVQYQLRAKDVLANAFVKDAEQAPQTSSIIPQTYSAALRLAANLQEKIEALEPKAEQYDQFMEARGFQTMNHVAKSLGTGRNRMMRFLRVRGVFMMDNTPYQRYINQGLFAVKQRVIMGRPCVQPFASPKGIAFIAKVMR